MCHMLLSEQSDVQMLVSSRVDVSAVTWPSYFHQQERAQCIKQPWVEFLCLRCLQLSAEYICPLPEVSAQSQLKLPTLCTMRGSGRRHESNPCCLFICSHLFLVTEARNWCVVCLGVSVNAGGYFHAVLLQAALHKHRLTPDLGQKKKKVYIRGRMMRWQYVRPNTTTNVSGDLLATRLKGFTCGSVCTQWCCQLNANISMLTSAQC